MIITWLISFAPIVVGFVAGLLYAWSFILQQKKWFGRTRPFVARFAQSVFFLVRIVILFFVAKYLLRSELIPSILGTLVFIITFWLVILRVKVLSYEWIWPVRN